MRTENSIKNSMTSILSSLSVMILGFISQAIFIRILGAEYLGLNGLFSNILTMLSIFELGIGSAIIYNLYRPIASENKEEIKSLMLFYKKAYSIIALIILCFGILLIPLLKIIVGEVEVAINIYLVYILFLLSTVVSYLMAYKRSLIYAYQRNYIVNIIHIGYLFLLNTSQLVILFYTKNYYIYLALKIIFQLLENIIITITANKYYPFLLERNVEKINKNTEKNIFNKVKALLFHKVGTIIINGTDNIIISYYLGVVTVGLYTNYNMIINAVSTLLSQMITSVTASVGNLIATESCQKSYEIFKKLRFLNFWFACFSAICILTIMQPFIKIWVGKEYLLSFFTLVTLVFNYFQNMMKNTYNTFKDSAGIWEEDKFVPLVESTLNIIFSIVCLKIFGLAGVFIGTIISGLALWCYSYPKFVYKKLFGKSYKNYAKETIGYIVLFILIATITYGITSVITLQNDFIQIIINVAICCIVPNLIMFMIFRRTENFQYFLELIIKILSKLPVKFKKYNSEIEK